MKLSKYFLLFLTLFFFVACERVERNVIGDWLFTYNWPKRPGHEDTVRVRFVIDSFFSEKDTGTWQLRNDSIILLFNNDYKTQYFGKFTSDTTLSGIMSSFRKLWKDGPIGTKIDTGIWSANRIIP